MIHCWRNDVSHLVIMFLPLMLMVIFTVMKNQHMWVGCFVRDGLRGGKWAVLREWWINFALESARRRGAADEVCSGWTVPVCQRCCCRRRGADWHCCHWSWHDRRAGEEVSCLMTVVMSNRKRPPRSSNGKPVCHPRPHSWRDEKCWNTVKLLSTVDFFQWCQPIGH